MNILIVDEDWWDRKRLEHLLKKAQPTVNICSFGNAAPALEFARGNPLCAAFIDMGKSIHVPGYFLAKDILGLQRTNIIFTSYEWENTQDAFELRVSGYIRKPLRYEKVLTELQNLRYPPEQTGQSSAPDHAVSEAVKQHNKLPDKPANLF